MKILFIAHRLPLPPDKGDKIRAYNILKYLARGNDVYLASLSDEKYALRHAEGLREFCREVRVSYVNPAEAAFQKTLALLSGFPASIAHFRSAAMRRSVKELASAVKFDIVFCSSSSTAQYAMDLGIKKVMDLMDCDSAKWGKYGDISPFPMNLVYRREAVLLRRYESAVIAKFDRLMVVSEFEKGEFAKFADTGRIAVMTNGVEASGSGRPEGAAGKKIILFMGMMNYLVNADAVRYFCGRVMPLVERENPDAEFHVLGRNAGWSVRALARKGRVVIAGFVDDLDGYMKRSSVFVAPLRISEGVQNKILRAMAAGLPVVATPQAVVGLNADIGKDLLVAETPENFAEKVNSLLKDPGLAGKIGASGRAYVAQNHSWEKNLAVLGALVDSIARPVR